MRELILRYPPGAGGGSDMACSGYNAVLAYETVVFIAVMYPVAAGNGKSSLFL